jgi:hypothetical protein
VRCTSVQITNGYSLHNVVAEFVWGYIEDYGTVHDINILWESEIWTYEPEHIKVSLRLRLWLFR